LKDYIYRGSLLLASEEPEATQHLHLDHLGTPRLITSAAGGGEVGRHTYFPFGAEVTDASQDGERMKFTGHERDLGDSGGGGALDYMHARHYSPHLCRFLAMDPAAQSVTLGLPQSWNKYAYVGNNPIKFTDPTGMCADPGGEGARVCISAFIPMGTFGPFKGDGRGAQSDGGTFRVQQTFNLTADGRGVSREKFTPGLSVVVRGLIEREAAVGRREVMATGEGILAVAEASDGLFFGLAPDLVYDFTLTPGEDGSLVVSYITFKSFQIYFIVR